MRVTAETKTATRQRILDSAKNLFAQQGFEAATTRDIARAAGIAAGTLFNYFPAKESIALCLISEAHAKASDSYLGQFSVAPTSLEEDLFGHVAAGLRRLKPYRKYLPAVLETSLAPSADGAVGEASSFRSDHLDAVSQMLHGHGQGEMLSPLALQLYWTLYMGVLTFWAKDSSPRQEDTLALLDQSLAMFVGWLTGKVTRPTPQG
jgi:AcrR family transcriptional regulator